MCKHKSVLFNTLNTITQRLCNSKAPKNRLFRPKCQNLFCRKAVPALPRGYRWVMTAAPRQCRDGPVATSGGPYGKNGTSPPCFQWLSTALKQDFHLSPFFCAAIFTEQKTQTRTEHSEAAPKASPRKPHRHNRAPGWITRI